MNEVSVTITAGEGCEEHNHGLEYRSKLEHTHDTGKDTVIELVPYEKSYKEHETNGTTIVMLIPSRTDTRYFHEYIYNKAEIEFIKGRLHFSNSKNSKIQKKYV